MIDCIGLEFQSLLHYIEHQILQHTIFMSHIVQYMGLIYVNCVSEPSNGQFYNADNPDDAVLRSRPASRAQGTKHGVHHAAPHLRCLKEF